MNTNSVLFIIIFLVLFIFVVAYILKKRNTSSRDNYSENFSFPDNSYIDAPDDHHHHDFGTGGDGETDSSE